jgi:hypothetical protein
MAENPMSQQRRYISYLLRLWQEGGGERTLWRASLESPQGGDRLGFASLEDLVAFLENETGASSAGLKRRDEGGRQPSAIPE